MAEGPDREAAGALRTPAGEKGGADGGLLLYCICGVDGLRGAERAQGAQANSERRDGWGRELRAVERGPLAAIVAPVPDAKAIAAPTSEELLRYQGVVEAQHALTDVLPVRFGCVLRDEAAVRAHLREEEPAYLRALERVSGAVEMGVRFLLPAAADVPPGPAPDAQAIRSGADYLRARLRLFSAENELRERGEALARAWLSAAASLYKEHRAELTPPRQGIPAVYSLYFLVPRADVAAFRAALSPLVRDSDVKLLVSGPWPPYNFV